MKQDWMPCQGCSRDPGQLARREVDPDGIRTRVAAVKGPCPGPLDDGAKRRCRRLENHRGPCGRRQVGGPGTWRESSLSLVASKVARFFHPGESVAEAVALHFSRSVATAKRHIV